MLTLINYREIFVESVKTITFQNYFAKTLKYMTAERSFYNLICFNNFLNFFSRFIPLEKFLSRLYIDLKGGRHTFGRLIVSCNAMCCGARYIRLKKTHRNMKNSRDF